MSDVSDLIGDLRAIWQSQPAQLVRFAERWSKVAGEAETQRLVVDREIQKVEVHSAGLAAQEMGLYRMRMSEGLTLLGQAGQDVNGGLRQVAPHIAEIRKKLVQVRNNLGFGVPSVGILAANNPHPWAWLAAAGLAGLSPLTNLVTEYKHEMIALAGAMDNANAKMDVLDELNTRTGGLLPQPPTITPN